MLDYLNDVPWHQANEFLMSGKPPVIVRLLALNAIFLAIFAVRRAAGAKPMAIGGAFLVQLAVLCANLLLIWQQPVISYLGTLIARF